MVNAIEIQNVHQKFRVGFWMKPVEILGGINLSVPEGSLCGFLGENGAGKTTLINLIVGLTKPTQGRIRIFGNDAISKEAKIRVGYLPERPYFHEHLTGEDFIKYFGALSGLKRSDQSSRCEKLLTMVGLGTARKVELGNYSKGMLQRIGIAQALVHDPDLLIFDEPMSGLDPVGRREIRELMVSLASSGKTVFFSTHVISDVEAICDRVAIIKKGQLIKMGTLGQLLNDYTERFEILFESQTGKPNQELALESVQKLPIGFKGIVLGQEKLKEALSRLIASNAKILSVTSNRSSLESYFMGGGNSA